MSRTRECRVVPGLSYDQGRDVSVNERDLTVCLGQRVKWYDKRLLPVVRGVCRVSR